MKIFIKRIDKSLPLPEYKTTGATAFDFSAREKITISPKSVGYISLNVVIKVPAGYVLQIFPRSSTHKKGLLMANSVGIIDQDFCGNNDEIKAAYYNFTDNEVSIERGDRIAQGIIKKIESVEWEEKEKMEFENRGGFGTTGLCYTNT